MKEDLITFETAVLAKEKGFNGYASPFCFHEDCGVKFSNTVEVVKDKRVSSPTQSLLQKWLRETKDMWVIVIFDGVTYSVSIYGKYTEKEIVINPKGVENWLITYEQALELGLQEALKLINIY